MGLALVDKDWAADATSDGAKVALFREYYYGDHEMTLTPETKSMLNISTTDFEQFNLNYCGMVVGAMSDRLTVDSVKTTETASEGSQSNAAQDWIDTLLADNRFDALQIDVREAALRDGETFVGVNLRDGDVPMLTHELTYDGDVGVLAVMDDYGTNMLAAVKIWWVGDKKRANIYFPDSVEKYWMGAAGDLSPFSEPVTVKSVEGKGAGIPLVRFSRRRMPQSELNDVLPLQQALNRALVDMVMASLLTGFSLMWAKGWTPSQKLTPGMILAAALTDANGTAIVPQTEEQGKAMQAMLSSIDLKRIEPGDLSQIINGAKFLIEQIGIVSSTPLPGMMGGDSQSGDALRQRDIRLLGKITSAQVRFGNAWEDVVTMAAKLQAMFPGSGSKSPELGRLNTKWKSGEIRNNTDIFALADWLMKNGHERAALRVLSQSTLADFSDDQITEMLDEKAADAARNLNSAVGSLPDFGNFSLATNGATAAAGG